MGRTPTTVLVPLLAGDRWGKCISGDSGYTMYRLMVFIMHLVHVGRYGMWADVDL